MKTVFVKGGGHPKVTPISSLHLLRAPSQSSQEPIGVSAERESIMRETQATHEGN